jgi:hypothetical protein
MSFVIASGGTTSNSIDHETGSMTIFGPAALTGVVAVEASADGGTTWNALVDLGVAVTIAATKATVIQGNFGLVRVKSNGAEGATRTFPVLTTRSGSRRAVSTNVLVTPLVEDLNGGGNDALNFNSITATTFVGDITGTVTGSSTPAADNATDLGDGTHRVRHGYFGSSVKNDGYLQFTNIADPAAPAATKAVVYCRNNGGKVELVARFPTGAIQQVAIEP